MMYMQLEDRREDYLNVFLLLCARVVSNHIRYKIWYLETIRYIALSYGSNIF